MKDFLTKNKGAQIIFILQVETLLKNWRTRIVYKTGVNPVDKAIIGKIISYDRLFLFTLILLYGGLCVGHKNYRKNNCKCAHFYNIIVLENVSASEISLIPCKMK